MATPGVLNLFTKYIGNYRNFANGHGVLVAVPLLVITAFCFSYVTMQTPDSLSNSSKKTTTSSKRPILFTGKSAAKIDDTTSQTAAEPKLELQPTSAASTQTPNAPSTSNPQTTAPTTNPQQASKTSTGSPSTATRASSLPVINVKLPDPVPSLLTGLGF